MIFVNALKKQGKETILEQLSQGVEKRRNRVERNIRYLGYHLMEENVSAKK